MRYKKKKRSYMFTDKTHPIEAILAVIIGVAILITIMVLSYKSSLSGGNGPIDYGIISFFSMIVSLGAFFVSVMSIRDKEVFRVFPLIGMLLNGFIFVALFVLYIVGMSM